MKPIAAVAAVAFATSLVLSACGGDDVSKTSGNASTGSSGTTSSPGNPSNPGGGTSIKAGWSATTVVDGNAGEGIPSVTIDAQGNATALWMTQITSGNFTGGAMWSSRYQSGKGWGAAIRIDSTDGTVAMIGSGAGQPRLVGTPDGHAIAMWEQQAPGQAGADLWARPYDPSTGWGTISQLTTNGTASDYAIGVDANGNAVAAWSQKIDGTGATRIFASRYALGDKWATPVQVPQPVQTGPGAVTGVDGIGIYNVSPSVSVAAAGNAVIAWRQTDLTRAALWTDSYTVAGGWGNASPTVIEIDNTAKSVGAPNIGIDPQGNITLVWGELDVDTSIHTTSMSQRFVPGSGWQQAQAVAPPVTESSGVLYNPVLAINAQGVTAVTWVRPDDTLQVSVADANGTWGPNQQLTAHASLNNGLPSIGIDDAGNVQVAWVDTSTSAQSMDILVNRYTQNAWGTATLMGTQPETAAYPALAVNATGNAALLWLRNAPSGGAAIQSNFYTPS